MTCCRSCSVESCSPARATSIRWRVGSNRRPRQRGCVRFSVAEAGYCGLSVRNWLSLCCREFENLKLYDPPQGESPLTCVVTLSSFCVNLPLAVPPRIDATGDTVFVRYAFNPNTGSYAPFAAVI